MIVLDPGHGGNDPGKSINVKTGKSEKELNLLISKKVGNYLTKNLPFVKVVYTRTKDHYLSLDQRCNIANKNNAQYFVSIHCNSSQNRYASGTETHIHTKAFKKSLKLAQFIEKEFKTRAKRKSRGIKTKKDRKHNLQVLLDTKMPSVLIECGFLTNKTEGKYLNSNYGQEIIASAIFRAIRSMIYYEYPKLKKENQKVEKSNKKKRTYYRIQFMASIDPISTDAREFTKIKQPIERIKIDYKSIYKYKYVVGKHISKKKAQKMLRQIKKLGYKDAYIIKMEM
ncbi:MAG: N-acetylmuramoyl-L-alanine amidase [Cytophagales bacterium]|nr:N-acetylmuramoyl-L-alanine amidase [Cytophagales bacterium]